MGHDYNLVVSFTFTRSGQPISIDWGDGIKDYDVTTNIISHDYAATNAARSPVVIRVSDLSMVTSFFFDLNIRDITYFKGNLFSGLTGSYTTTGRPGDTWTVADWTPSGVATSIATLENRNGMQNGAVPLDLSSWSSLTSINFSEVAFSLLTLPTNTFSLLSLAFITATPITNTFTIGSIGCIITGSSNTSLTVSGSTDCQYVQFTNNTSLTTLDLSGLTMSSITQRLKVTGNTSLTIGGITLPTTENVLLELENNNPSITSINVSSQKYITLSIKTQPNLTSITLNTTDSYSLRQNLIVSENSSFNQNLIVIGGSIFPGIIDLRDNAISTSNIDAMITKIFTNRGDIAAITTVGFDNRLISGGHSWNTSGGTNGDPTGTVQQGDIGTYGGSLYDLTKTQVNNLKDGNDYDGAGSNTAWTVGEMIWWLVNSEVSSADTTGRYKWTFTL